MKLTKIEIDHFGKLNNFSLYPSDGLNLVYGRNEDGKSTIMAFIRMMFYGNVGSAREVSANARKHYKPWNGTAMGGAVEFEAEGVNYRLQKHFGQTAGRDEVELINLDTGENVALPHDKEIGAHFFKMNLEGFERSVFIGKSGGFGGTSEKNSSFAAGGEKNAGITERLINLTTGADEKLSLKNTTLALQTAMEKLVSKRGNNGLLVEAREHVRELDEELRAAKILESSQRNLRENLDMLIRLQEAEKERLKAVKTKRQQAEELRNELFARREEGQAADRRMELFEAEKNKREQVAALKTEQLEERINTAKSEAESGKEINLVPVFAIAAALVAIIAITLMFLVNKHFIFLLLAVPVLVFAEFSAVSRKKRVQNHRKSAAEQVVKLEEELEELLENTGREASRDEEVALELNKQLEASKTGILRTEKRLNEINKQLQSDEGLEDRIMNREHEIAAMKADYRSPARSISMIAEEKAEVEEKMQHYEEYYSALTLALENVEKAADEVRKNFGPKLSEKTAEFFSGLTGGRYRNVTVSKNFEINVLEDGDTFYHENGYLSNGTVDQVYFALRLAIVEILSEESGRLPLLLDDIFEQYDDIRTTDGIVFLKTYAAEQSGQVLLFTCHEHIMEKAERIAPGVKLMRLSD